MNTRQLLTSAIAATTIVGTIGLAYAQSSTDSTTQPQSTDMNTPAQTARPAQDSSMPSSTTTAPAASDSSTPAPAASTDNSANMPATSSEPAPKPDRN